ncbi:MAG: hypothetical protein ACYTG0_25940, partial [Planctomycetota bacterium]
MANVTVVMSGEEAGLWRAQQRVIDQQKKMEDGYQKAGRAGKRAGDDTNRGFLSTQNILSGVKAGAIGIAGVLGVGGGAAGIIGIMKQITQESERWRAVMDNVAASSKQAANEVLAFSALQQTGTKGARALEAATLGARYGVGKGEAFSTVQALQSVLGDYQQGLQAAETTFAAAQVGIPVELGRELEVLGLSQGQAPGDMLRRAFVAGEASGRDPKALAKAAPAMSA